MTIIDNGAMRNVGGTNSSIRKEAIAMISDVSAEDLGRSAGTLHGGRGDSIRVDMQGQTSSGHSNIQIQLNGVRGNSTIATILAGPNASTSEMQAALKKSLSDGQVYKVE
jgi:hypothetical protein